MKNNSKQINAKCINVNKKNILFKTNYYLYSNIYIF